MRFAPIVLATALATTTSLVGIAPAHAHPAPTAAFVTTDSTTTTARDRRREHAAQRASRAGQRGGAGPFLDSNYEPVWDRVSVGARSVWLCIRKHESIMAGHYTAQNPVSSASGAGQWLDSTWRGVAYWVKVHNKYVARKYSRAKYAPAWVQDAAFVHVYKHGGLSMWRGTGCSGT